MSKEETASFIRAYLDGDTSIGNIISIRDVLESAIVYLKEQPSLPEGLEEAAKEFSHDQNYPIHAYGGFKAGAEWQAGQGDSIATRLIIDTNGKVNINFAIGDITDENNIPKYIAGDDVIIQIRKK